MGVETLTEDLKDKDNDDDLENVHNSSPGNEDLENVLGFDVEDVTEALELVY